MRLLVARLIIGFILGVIGYAVGSALNAQPYYQLPLVVGFALGITGVILVRAISEFFANSVRYIAQLVATQVLREIRIPGVPRLRPDNHKTKVTPKYNFPNPLLLDTSAIIDGRILEIIQTEFIFGTIIIPSFILKELQAVSDSADNLKRSKGKRGLEILEKIKKNRVVPVKVIHEDPAEDTTDLKLIHLARVMKGKIVTTDFNLNKVAKIQGVRVLNVNELAEVVKTPVVPGENLKVKIVQAGKEKNQGVGYLADGTMIVVEEGLNLVGKNVDTIVSRLIQTAAGKMIFTEIKK